MLSAPKRYVLRGITLLYSPNYFSPKRTCRVCAHENKGLRSRA
ncbi:hypothetical protein GCWU000325_00705 [Alloprevotella tannerae ATCC 51259]|uniref:Uncharacterized protein n=1 Tax=Alloprevotella tannerae ATCC 51259 TaxID=626522 RepID=C9LES4_9BACT|nr:hypothetical protein GCWU000325_00705 [Alloprevotella tannerae ATCC 51259]